MSTKVFSIFNHKGGVGKSTIATNLAGYLANQNYKVWFGDFDVQQSSRNWLSQRSPHAAKIEPWEIKDNKLVTVTSDVDFIIIDSPAGVNNLTLKKLVSLSDKVIVPVCPSLFDIMSTETFLEEIVDVINNQSKNTDLGLVGNMVNPETMATTQLKHFLNHSGLNVPTLIKKSQVYVELAAHGLTLFDGKSSSKEFFKEEKEDWTPLINWLFDKPSDEPISTNFSKKTVSQES